MVDLQNSNKGINKEAEDKAKTQEKKEENTLFSLFNANKGSEIPNISASPSVKRDNPVKVAQSMAAPEKKDFFIKKRSEYEINEKNDNSRAGSFSVNHHEKSQFQEEDSGVEIISEAQTDDISEDKTDDNEKEASKSTEIFQQEEEKRGSESISIEKTPSNPSEIEKQELRKKEFRQPHKESGNDKELHPLNNEEWFQTLKMEHTKMLLSYDVVILNTLKNKYTEYFADMPINFDEMIDKLKTRVSVPYAEEIKKIRHERDQFLHYHKTVSMEELKNAYETTVLFLREFS